MVAWCADRMVERSRVVVGTYPATRDLVTGWRQCGSDGAGAGSACRPVPLVVGVPGRKCPRWLCGYCRSSWPGRRMVGRSALGAAASGALGVVSGSRGRGRRVCVECNRCRLPGSLLHHGLAYAVDACVVGKKAGVRERALLDLQQMGRGAPTGCALLLASVPSGCPTNTPRAASYRLGWHFTRRVAFW
jgi:hypothetical protein